MAFRSRRAWSTLRDEIRTLLRETTSADSFWPDADLLILANHAIDQRCLEMMEAHEGWFTQPFLADIVANQREYSLPEGTDRVRDVFLRYSESGTIREIALPRYDRISADYWSGNTVGGVANAVRPAWRIVDNLLYIEPPISEARTNGLRIEAEGLPPRLTGDASKLALTFPISQEDLLIYDVWALAMGIEDAQANVPINPEVRNRLDQFHRRLEEAWRQLIQVRNQSRVFGQGLSLGD